MGTCLIGLNEDDGKLSQPMKRPPVTSILVPVI